MERIAICGGRLLTPQGILEQHILLAEDGVITVIIPEITPISTDYRRVDAKDSMYPPASSISTSTALAEATIWSRMPIHITPFFPHI